MPASKAQQKAVNKYMRENYDRVNLTMPKGRKEEIKAHSEARGESVNGFINRAISEAMERDNIAPTASQGATGRTLSSVEKSIVLEKADDQPVENPRNCESDAARSSQHSQILEGKFTSTPTMSRQMAKKFAEAAIANTGTIAEFTDADRLEMVTGELRWIVDDFIRKANDEFANWPDIVKMDDGAIRDMLRKAISASEELIGLL